MTSRAIAAWASVIVLVAMVACSGREDSSASALPSIPFEKYSLANGLEVILSEDRRLPLVAVDIWYHVGPVNEAAGRTGFAHLFEHMMFQGSKHVPPDAHFPMLEAAGGSDLNGTTDFDRTNYFETVPSNRLELALWLESDRMGYLLDTVDEAKFANQQDVVRNERRQNTENQPYGLVQEALFHQLFPKGHPYYASVIGSHTDIQAAKLDDVKAFFKQYYAPNNASLAIVGDIDKAAVKKLVERYFGTLKRGPAPPKVTVQTPPITAERRVVVPDQVELPRVYMAWLTPPFFKPGDSEADAAAGALGGGNSSRLYKKLVYEKQIAQDVVAYQYSLALQSVFQIVATVRPGHTAAEVEAAIAEEVEAFRKSGPSEAEVERARNTFETRVLTGLEMMGGFGGVADTLNMFNHYVGDPGYLPKYLDEHRRLTPAAIKTFAEQYLKPTARVIVHGVPGQPDLGAAVPTPPMPKVAPGTGAEAINADEPWRKDPPPPGAPLNVKLSTPGAFTLPNGLTVIHQKGSNMPVAAATLVLKTGGDANPVDRPGLASFTAAMLEQGTESRNALAIADALAQIGASLEASSSKDSIVVSVGSLSANAGAALDLLADVAQHPNFPQAEVERQRASRLASLIAARQNPATAASMAAVAALYGGEHPYGYIELGTEAAMKATTRDDLVAFWKQNFVPGNAALVVTGSLTEAELRKIVTNAFGGWPTGSRPPVSFRAPSTTDARVVIVNRPGAPQTQLLVATIGAQRSAPDYAALNVLNAALGGLFSSRINMNLREKNGYTYGASSQFLFRKGPGPFWVQTGVRTDVTVPAVGEILKEIRATRDAPLSNEELVAARDSIVRGLPSDFETSARTSNVLSSLFVYDLGRDYYGRDPAAVNAVTVADAQAAGRKYLDPTKMIVVAVGDRTKIEAGLKKLNLGRVVVQ